MDGNRVRKFGELPVDAAGKPLPMFVPPGAPKPEPHHTVPVNLYRLENKAGTQVEICDLGGAIHSFIYKNKKTGKTYDIVMGHDSLDDQFKLFGYNGGMMGRVVNRIWKGKIWIYGKLHQLELTMGDMVMHGGKGMYAKKLFQPRLWEDDEGEKLTLYLKDTGEGGFPGEVDVWITYVLTPKNELKLQYKCLPTEDTILNITSHVYFNVGGHDSGTVADDTCQLNANFFTPVDETGLPTGEILKVDGTVFDFRTPRTFRGGLESDDRIIKMQHGYDINLCLAGGGLREGGWVSSAKSGLKLSFQTDMPGVQLYTASNDPPGTGFKGGATYEKYGAVCLETQYYPNATAHSHFPQPVFPANQVFNSETVFTLSEI
jgi:aldose 1-epimerase